MPDKQETDHPDAQQDAQQLRPVIEGLTKAIQLVAAHVDHIKGRHDALEKLVTDDLIGGIHSMYQAKVKGDRIEGLKSKYSSELQPHFDALSHVMPGVDHWDHLHEHTKGMEGEALDGHIHELSKGLGEVLGKVRGQEPPKPEGIEPEGNPDEIEGAPGGVKVAKVEEKKLPPEEGKKVEKAAGTIAKVAEKAVKEPEKKGEEPEPKKKSKDELIAEKMSKSKDFKLR